MTTQAIAATPSMRYLAERGDSGGVTAFRQVEFEIGGPGDVGTARQHAFLRSLDRVPRLGRLPRYDRFDPVEFWPCIGYLHKIDYLPRIDDFRYRAYGSEVARYSGFDMTGRCVGDSPGEIGPCLRDAYRALRISPRIVRSETETTGAVATRRWTRLVCPAAGPDGDIVGFLVLTEPVLPYRPLPPAPLRTIA